MTAKSSSTGSTITNSTGPNTTRTYAPPSPPTTGPTSTIWPDFGIDVTNTPACTAPPVAGNAITSVPFVCPNTNFQLNIIGAAIGSDITYQWQSSPDGTNWTDIAGATSSR